MSFVVIVGLVVAVIALLITNNQLSKTIERYEAESTKKTRKVRKNGTK